MSDRSTKHPPAVDDLLAPPPFGVAETTGDQLLPIATSMEHVLDEDALLPPPGPEPVAVASLAASTQPIPAESVAVATELEEPRTSSNRTLVIVVVVILVLGAGGFWWMNRGGEGRGDRAGLANADPVSSSIDETPAAPSAVSPQNGHVAPPTPSVVALPTELEALRELSFEERHAGLASALGEVPVDLHVGLDLVQAQQSGEPCRTFSDALSIIESSEDPATFTWAVDEAGVPTQGDAQSCTGLAERLAVARGPGDEVEAPNPPRARPRTSRGHTRSKHRASRPSRAVEPPSPAEPEAKPNSAKPNPPPARAAPSVATKLDDDLRGLGE
ncbi:MAG: hypothetical protein KUG77_05845 [Nannocystaceae bacterium]|nr:hypothetical protein [Nannocystaceae bacterium]